MSLPVDAAPPGHLPPAASAPWPLQPPPHGAAARSIPVRPVARATARGKGPFGLAGTLVAAAAAAAVGLAVAIPLLVRKPKPAVRNERRKRAKA